MAGYSKTLNLCYLSNPTKVDQYYINNLIDKANDFVDNSSENYEKFVSKHWSFSESCKNKKEKDLLQL